MNQVRTQTANGSDLRQNQRVLLSIGIEVRGETLGNKEFSEATSTLIVNPSGALILLEAKVSIGQLLTIKNMRTKEELYCRVANFGPIKSGVATVGIKFLQPAPKFWRIAFPPSDWSLRSPEAKRPTPSMMALQRTA
jgi:hypothetical protein